VPLHSGDRIDRYIIDALLGTGGMGEVYRAHDARLLRPVALKILRPPADDSKDTPPSAGAERMLREARTAAALQHPNVVAVYDVGQVDAAGELRGTTYIAMELVVGRSLRAYVGDATVPMDKRIGWLKDIARALGAAHDAGIVHRDVKPENVMIGDDGVVKVLDFGVAKRTGGSLDMWTTEEHSVETLPQALGAPAITQNGQMAGTPYYMAPEQLREEPLDARADQFAWGVVAYELLGGKGPWAKSARMLALASQILSTEPKGLRELDAAVPEGAARVVRRALAKTAEARFRSMADVVAALDGRGAEAERAKDSTAPGTDLQTRLEKGPLSVEETLAMAQGLARALAYLHDQGLIHRDLQPSHLFLPGGDAQKVRLVAQDVATRTSTGTPSFLAPEQARGDRDVAPAADVFALGCILFECLTGKRLFAGAHPMSVLAKVLLEDAPRVSELRPDVPAFLDALVSRMVDKDPAKRPADGAELARWLTEADRAPAPPREALTSNERRVVTVLVVPRSTGEAPAEEAQFQAAVSAFGVRAHTLVDRTVIALAPEHLVAADQASLLARFARHLVETRPDAALALTTGSATHATRLPVGQAIDRAVAMVRAPEGRPGVQVDDATAALIAARFDVKGGRIVAERASLDPTCRLLGKPTSCVGREGELATLETAFAACAAGHGPKVVLVTAEAGAGKSRLQHEFDRRLRANAPEARVLRCSGDLLRASIPHAMVSQLVRQAAGLEGGMGPAQAQQTLVAHVTAFVPPAEVRRVSAFLGELVEVRFDDRDDLPLRAARHNPLAMADQIGRAFEDIVRGWCEREPLLVVLEDLHWGHASCVKLFDRVLGKLAGARSCLVALARPEVRGRFPALFAKRDVTEIHLPPLPGSAAAKLVREVLGSGVTLERVEQIIQDSEGNAFCLEELIRAEDAPVRASIPASAQRGDLPDAVLAIAQARLERLEPEARKVLRAASVFGDVFWVEGVSALVGQGPAQIERALSSLLEEEAVAHVEHARVAGASEFAFRHALLRGTAYATLTEEDRTLGHRLAAGWLEGLQEDGELVARHWLEGGEPAQAASAFLRAGESRHSRSQPDAAARSVARALLVVTEDTTDLIPRCVELLTEALTATRSIDAADVIEPIEAYVPRFETSARDAGRTITRALLDRALDLLRAVHHPGLVATLASAATAIGGVADFAAAKAFLEEAAMLAIGDDTATRRLRYASATVAFWSGNASSVVELLSESSLPEEPAARFQSLVMLAFSVVFVGGRAAVAHGLDLVDQAQAMWRPTPVETGDDRAEDPVAAVLCAKARQACLTCAGEHARAAEAADEGVALARRAGLRYEECAQLGNAAEQYFHLGEHDRARALALESRAITVEIGADHVARHNDALLAHLDRSPDRLQQIAADARAASDPVIELTAYYWRGHLLAELRDPDCRATLEHALTLALDLGIRHLADDCTRLLATLDAPPPPP
jgi:serine/threonine protein kinase